MPSHPTTTQRIALWHAYKHICVYCNNPIDSLAELDIDHIIPQHLRGKPRFSVITARLGYPELDIDSYLNWLPVHQRPCNRNKGATVLPDPALHNLLNLARKHEAQAIEEERKMCRQDRNGKALAALAHRIEIGEMSESEAISFIREAGRKSTPKKSDPLVLSFGTNVTEIVELDSIPRNMCEPPDLYDFLEKQLEDKLHETIALFAKIESGRNGETVSVRYACWLLDLESVPERLPYGWELLDAAPFSEVYPDENAEETFAQAILATHDDLVFGESRNAPYVFKRCPQCMSTELSVHQQEDMCAIRCKCGWIQLL